MVSNKIEVESIQPLLVESKNEHIIIFSTHKYKVKQEYNFVGNFKRFNNLLPIELLNYFSIQEYELIINDINKIVKSNKIPIILSIIFQIFILLPLIFFALTNNLPFLYLTLGLLIVSTFISAFISIKIQNKVIKNLENYILILNNNIANKNVIFEIEKKYSKIYNKFYIDLFISLLPSAINAPSQLPQPYVCQSLPLSTTPSLNEIDNNYYNL